MLSAQGTSKCFFDDGSLQSVDISPDQNLMVACRHIGLPNNCLKELGLVGCAMDVIGNELWLQHMSHMSA